MENISLPHDKAEAIDLTSFEIPINICLTHIPASISVLAMSKFDGPRVKKHNGPCR